MKNLLEIRDLNLTYHTQEFETKALNNISFSINEGEFISIVGPSGCGKTTILSLVAGLLTPSSGEILLKNTRINGINQNVGYMFQQDTLFDWLTVEQNVLFGLKLQKRLNNNTKSFALGLLEKYGLKEFLHHYPTELSGGMRQRVSLIRTLSTNPSILLLDEPFSALDYQTRLNIQQIVHQIIKDENKTVLLVTHDISEAVAMADRILILSERPATIKKDITMTFPCNSTPHERRDNPLFNLHFNQIWGELKQ